MQCPHINRVYMITLEIFAPSSQVWLHNTNRNPLVNRQSKNICLVIPDFRISNIWDSEILYKNPRFHQKTMNFLGVA